MTTHFDSIANEWDSPEKMKLMQDLSVNTLENLELGRDLKILDIGCGTGLFSMSFADFAKEIVGVDTSEGMLKVFKSKSDDKLSIRTINLNLDHENLDETFDFIVSSMAFHHLENPKLVLNKVYQMLNPKGIAVIVDLDKEDGTFHPDNETMGVKHFGFSKEELLLWSQEFKSVEHKIIHRVVKNDKSYPMFMLKISKS